MSKQLHKRPQASSPEVLPEQLGLLELVVDPVLAWRIAGGIVFWNRAAEELYGYAPAEALGRVSHDLLRTEFPGGITASDLEATLARDGHWFGELKHRTRDGREVIVDARLRLIEPGRAGVAEPLVLEVNRDSTARKRAEARSRARARQQEALAVLGQDALASDNLDMLVARTAAGIADVLGLELVQVQELSDDGRSLLLRGGVGWEAGATGRASVGVGTDSQAGFALVANEPVVVADIATERRFAPPDFLRRHGAVSGVSIVIPGHTTPYGVLSVHARARREFSPDEIHFLRAVANVLGAMIRDHRAARALREGEARMRAIVDTAVDAIITIDERGNMDSINRAACTMFGYGVDELRGRNVRMLMPEPYRGEHDGYLAAYLRTGRKRIIGIGREVVGLRKDGVTFPIDLAVSEFHVGDRRMFTGLIRDLTERRRLEREILAAGAQEQRRIGHDLHDGLCQQLAGCAFALEVLGQKLEARRAPETPNIRKVSELVDQAITQARALAHGLQPVTLEAAGLTIALRDLAAKAESMFGVTCMFVSDAPVLVHDNTVATHLYRIAQEAISNAVKHGRPRTVVIDLAAGHGQLRLTIGDDGVGLGNAAPGGRGGGKGIGLQTMVYRARTIGGTLDVRPGERGGTIVICTVPLVGPTGEDTDGSSREARQAAQAKPRARRRPAAPAAPAAPRPAQAKGVRRRRPPDRP
jgi:PAS domain S-box-containing protein